MEFVEKIWLRLKSIEIIRAPNKHSLKIQLFNFFLSKSIFKGLVKRYRSKIV